MKMKFKKNINSVLKKKKKMCLKYVNKLQNKILIFHFHNIDALKIDINRSMKHI